MDRLNLRDSLKSLVALYYEEPLMAWDVLLSEVKEHAARTREVAQFSPVHIPIARALGDGLEQLISSVTDDTPEEEQRLIQAACKYFVDPEDESPDMNSPFGFHDDAEVFNAVAEAVGRADLVFDF